MLACCVVRAQDTTALVLGTLDQPASPALGLQYYTDTDSEGESNTHLHGGILLPP